jgi:hypothetical protein
MFDSCGYFQRKAIFIIIALLLLALYLLFRESSIYFYKVVSYKDIQIEYKSYLNGNLELESGRSIQNRELLRQANLKLANRLLDKYLITKDKLIENKIMSIVKEFSRNKYLAINIDSVIKYKTKILDTTMVFY